MTLLTMSHDQQRENISLSSNATIHLTSTVLVDFMNAVCCWPSCGTEILVYHSSLPSQNSIYCFGRGQIWSKRKQLVEYWNHFLNSEIINSNKKHFYELSISQLCLEYTTMTEKKQSENQKLGLVYPNQSLKALKHKLYIIQHRVT